MTVAGLLLISVAAATLFMHTGFALRWALAAVEKQSAGMLHVANVQGTLSGPITLNNVEVKTPAFDAHIDRIKMDWLPFALLVNRLEITAFTATHVNLVMHRSRTNQPFHLVRPVAPHLPVIVIVSNVVVSDMTVSTPQLAQPLHIERLDTMAYLDNGEWRIPQLSLSGQHIRAHGHGDWTFTNAQQLDTALDWNIDLPGQPPFSGQASITGGERRLAIKMRLRKPAVAKLDAVVGNLFSKPDWHGTFEFARVHAQDLFTGLPAIDVGGTSRFSGTPVATRFGGGLDAQESGTGKWHGEFTVQYRNGAFDVDQFNLVRKDTPTHIRLAGSIGFSGGLPVPDLRGEWRALPLPLTGRPWFESPHGTLAIEHQNDALRLKLNGELSRGGKFEANGNLDLRSPAHDWSLVASAQHFRLSPARVHRSVPGFDWVLHAGGDAQHTRIDDLVVSGFGGEIDLKGQYANTGTNPWHATLTARHLNPGMLFPGYQGNINLTAGLSGHRSPSATCTLQLKSLHGTLRDAPISASGGAQCIGNSWVFRNVNADIAGNRFGFDGHLGRKTRFDWNLNAPKLAAVWPGLTGSLTSRGSLELAGKNPVARFTLHAANLHYGDYTLKGVDANVAMNNSTQGGEATLEARNMILDGTAISHLTAHATGSLAAHRINLTLNSAAGAAEISGEGAFADDTWRGDLQHVKLRPGGAGTWEAGAIWRVRIGKDGLSLPDACLVQDSASTCVTTAWQRQRWHVNAKLNAVPLHDLQALLPPGLDYTGTFAGTLRAGGDTQQHQVDLTATLSPGSVHNVIHHRRVTLLDYTHGDAHIHMDTDHSSGALHWALRDGGYLNVDTRIDRGPTPSLKGRIQGELHDFALIPALIPDVSGFEGKLRVDLALGGTARNPTFDGTASLKDGAIRVPRLGLNVANVMLALQGNGHHLVLNGTAESASGTLKWDSTAQKQNGIWHAQGHLQGTDFRAADIPEAQVNISPALDFKLDDRDITLDGTVTIPYAKLRPRNLSNTAQVSPDQVIVGQNQATAGDHWNVHARVLAKMGNQVDIKGFGLSGRITGGVQLVDEPGHFTTGSGELQIVDGHYTAYGQNLSIDRGRLMFNGGPVSNPALDIRALRKPAHPDTVLPGQSEQQVGVVVRGTLREPSVSLFSDPPLPQSSLLAYLLTGQLPATPSQSPLLGQPATDTGDAIAYSSGEFLAQQVGNQIGLSDVSIQNVSTGIGTSTPSLFIGKYLSPRLYVSYGAGILQSINTIRIRYTLGARWMLEAESGAANSADLIYTLEH